MNGYNDKWMCTSIIFYYFLLVILMAANVCGSGGSNNDGGGDGDSEIGINDHYVCGIVIVGDEELG